MELVLLYVVLTTSLAELALLGIKRVYRNDRVLRLRQQMTSLSRKDNALAHHDLSVEIVAISLLPVKISCLPNEVKWRFLPFSLAISLLLAGIFLWAALVLKMCPSCPASIAIIASWAAYRLLMACSDRMASKKNLIANAIRAEKFAEARTLVSRTYMASSLILGLIVYYTFS
jgi:hypothetical protein